MTAFSEFEVFIFFGLSFYTILVALYSVSPNSSILGNGWKVSKAYPFGTGEETSVGN